MLNLVVSALPCPSIFAMLSCLSKEMHVKALLAILGGVICIMFILRVHIGDVDISGEGIPPFYYGTHYSSAMIVASYLIRMEPFTGHFIKLQVG